MKNFMAAITAVGGYVPRKVLSNHDLEQMVDTSNEWIISRTGIKERRILDDPEQATSDMAAEAIKNLLEKYAMNPSEIEGVVLATSTPDKILAPTAPVVCQKAGLEHAWGFDLNAACSGFLYALSTASAFIEAGRHRKIIVVGVDAMSRIVDYTDRNTCILFGDGAGAVLLEPSTQYGLQEAILKANGSGSQYLSVPGGGSLRPFHPQSGANQEQYVKQDGRMVFKNAIEGMTSVCRELLKKQRLTSDTLDWVVPHQANIRIINAVAENLNVPMEKVKVNIERYGNTTAATVPLCLWDFKDDFKPGDKILFTSFGAGFTFGAAYLTWEIA